MAKNDIVKVSIEANKGIYSNRGTKTPLDEFILHYRCDNIRGGYNENKIKAIRYSDGALSVASEESFVYLYPQQIKHLKKILAIRPPNKFKGTKKQHKFRETARQAE